MKRCPKCGREYTDETLNFCLDDGEWLVDERPADEPQTAVLPDRNFSSEAATQAAISHTSETSVHTTSSAEYIFGEIKKKKGTILAFVLIGLVSFGVLMYVAIRLLGDKSENAKTLASSLKIQPLSATGDVAWAAISPDGKFLAYVQNESGKYSLWTKQISTNSSIQITQPGELPINGLAFSPDGDYIFYTGGDRHIYRVSKLGGQPVSVVTGADSRPSFAPDGKQFAFSTNDATTVESAVIIVNSDGTGERKLIARSGHEWINSPDWSPDGKLISINYSDDREDHPDKVAVVAVDTGELKEFSQQHFDAVRRTVWLRDMSGIIFLGSVAGGNTNRQIWEISYPGGEARQVTHDLMDYRNVSLTADSKTLIAVQDEGKTSIWVSPDADISKTEQISKAKDEGGLGIGWTADNKIVYGSTASGSSEIWVMDKDGSHAKQLTNDGISKYTPAASADGRYIVFVSEKDGRHIWRINSDGSQPTQLTNGNEDANPRISPDSKWVVYSSSSSGSPAIWRVPLSGGDSQKLTDFPSTEPDVSWDGQFISCFYFDTNESHTRGIAIIPFNGGKPLKSFGVPQTVNVDMSPIWMPDGRGVTYVDDHGNVTDLWLQPIEGGPAKQLTDYKRESIFRREWTRDGKQVAVVRFSETSDVVMITDFR